MANRRFEDFEMGREFAHAPGRAILDADGNRDIVPVVEFEHNVPIPKRGTAYVPA